MGVDSLKNTFIKGVHCALNEELPQKWGVTKLNVTFVGGKKRRKRWFITNVQRCVFYTKVAMSTTSKKIMSRVVYRFVPVQ